MRKGEKHDQTLFEAIKAGKMKSFELLYEQYYVALCNFAYLFLKNEDHAREVVSDVFVNVWIKRDQIVIQKSIKSYLYKSTRNAVVSFIRKNKEIRVSLDDVVEKGEPGTPETLLIKKEFDFLFKLLLDELPPKAGLVLRLKKIDGLRYKEISEVLNISEKTVENHISKAIKKLKALLDKNPELYRYFKD